MGLLEDFKIFRDKNGLNQLDPNSTSQNGTLFTMEYLICLMADPSISDEQKKKEIDRLKPVFLSLERYPGLSVRFPESGEYESMDNTCATIAFSALFDGGNFARRMHSRGLERVIDVDLSQDSENNKKFYKIAKILSFGFQPNWVFNNQNPSLFCMQGWFGRSPAMMGLIKMAAGEFVNPFLWASVLVGQFIGAFKHPSDLDARKLSYVNWQYLKTRSKFWNAAYKLWCWKLMQDYENGMKDIYTTYYLNPEHPIKKYSICYAP